jgi:photosystem II stability/assembly factor-like uncharacterized protein
LLVIHTPHRLFALTTGVLLGVALSAALSAQPALLPQPGHAAAEPNAVIDPSLLSGLSYRALPFTRGGRVTAVAGLPADPLTYFFGSTGGGVWRTRDAGQTWVPLTDGQFDAGGVGAIAIADSDPNVMYVGTGSACPRGNVSPGIGIYKTQDGGETWKHIGLRTAGQIGRIRVHPKNPDLVYAAVLGNVFGPSEDRGVYRSSNGGATWEKVLFVSARTGAVDIAMNPLDPRVLYAAMWTVERKPWTIDSGSLEGGLFKSTDAGDHWTKLGDGLPSGVLVGKIGVTISPANPDRLWAVVEAANEKAGVYRTDDAGRTWQRTSSQREMTHRAWYFNHIVADPVDPNVVYALNTFLFRSTDGGKSFAVINGAKNDNHDLWINPRNPRAMVLGDDGGAAVSLTAASAWSTEQNQPTAELYRVAVDNRYPYRLYSAQQDNSTVSIASFNDSDGGGGYQDVGGCESSHIAVDPQHPAVIYAGCFGGAISRTDLDTGIATSVRVYPEHQTGHRAADLTYRFQWNFPIRFSRHTPGVLYATSQFVHRSTDEGHSWKVISPDLTRNDKTKQDYSGGRGITRDSTGVEVYDTIFAFEESPVARGVFWAGSDDGRVHVSRDDGATWTDVTPKGMPEFGCVNSIDPSPHDPGRATIAVYKYRQNDFSPYIFQTDDFGKTWRRLTDGENGIPSTTFTRVVREDPDRKGLLYAGTEFGLYVSFDNGTHWQRLQLNLPVTPVTDLAVHQRDLVVATQGRGFWILDDLSPLHQLSPATLTQRAALLKPREAYRTRNAVFVYYFAEAPGQEVRLDILDGGGAVVASYSGLPGVVPPPPPRPAGYPPDLVIRRATPTVTLNKGINTFTWNMAEAGVRKFPEGAVSGPRVVPGTYQVRLTSGNWSQTQPLLVKADPRVTLTAADYAAQRQLAREIAAKLGELYEKLAAVRGARQQALGLAARVAHLPAGKEIQDAATALSRALLDSEKLITQLEGIGGQDTYYYPGMLDSQLLDLYYEVTGGERPLTQGSTARWADLQPLIADVFGRADRALTTDVEKFNALVRRKNIDPVVIKVPAPW